MMNRKLVRPKLAEVKQRMTNGGPATATAVAPDPGARRSDHSGPRRRPAPPELTNAEAFYYLKQMNAQTPMIVVLDGGERLLGHIEWYDRGCLKIHREDGPNLLVYKHAIRYMYKQEEEEGGAD